MKKGIIVLLIAVLVSGFAFAGFSGYAGIQLNADLDNESYGFANKTSVGYTFEFSTASVEIGGENIHAELAASAKAIIDKQENAAEFLIPGVGATIEAEPEPVLVASGYSAVYDDNSEGFGKYAIGILFSIDTAKIVGDGWYVSILNAVKNSYDYAKAAVSTAYQDKDKNAFGMQKRDSDGNLKWKKSASSYSVQYDKAPGVTFGYAGFTASVGFKKVAAGTAFSATIETPEFAFSDDAVKLQIAAEASKVAGSGYANAGASAKTTVAIQDITFAVAADLGVEKIGADEATFDMDARADFKYSFIDFNVYTYIGKTGILYGGSSTGKATKKYHDFYLEAKAAFDLNAFELPLKFAVTAKNIVDKSDAGLDLGVSVDFAKDALTAGASYDINFLSHAWTIKAKAKYAFEQFTVGAGIKFTGADEINTIKFGAFAETEKLVQNMRLGLGYGLNADNLMEDGAWTAIGDGEYSSDYKAGTAGVISAYAIIKF